MIARTPALLSCLLSAFVVAQESGHKTGIAWQRTLEDALAVQKATGLPLLIAVNQSGEVFNDRFAGTVYQDPAFIASTRGYVCVIASPDRHNDRDYDALGRRVDCPMFPGCTCSEHINIEPELYRRYFHGNRNAPRHLAVAPDGTILFDRFLDASMQTAIDAIGKNQGTPNAAAIAPTTELATLLTRRDAASRAAVEDMYRTGDSALKRRILAAAETATNEPFDLLRMALRENDEALFAAAARVLAHLATKESLIDIEDALARLDDKPTIALLLERLQQLGTTTKAAARLYSHFDRTTDEQLSVPWSNEWAKARFDPAARESIEAELDRCEAQLKTNHDDEEARLQLATAKAAFGDMLVATGGKGVELWFDDAILTARNVKADERQAEAQAVIAVSAWRRNDAATAYKASILALSTAKSSRQPNAWLAAQLLDVIAQTTAQVGYAAAQADADASLRAELARTDAALRLLVLHHAGDEKAQLAGIGLLEFGGLRRLARNYLLGLAEQFPASPAVHERLRQRLLIDLGAEAMRVQCAAIASRASDQASAQWFLGYANLVAAEQHVRDSRPELARAAYDDAIAAFGKSAAQNPDFADSANHFAVLALGGRALQRHLAGDGEGAVADLLRAGELRPGSLDEADGLERKPRALAGRIARELRAAGKTELADRLAAIVQ